ncbi:MAG: hypothetical protein ACXAC2_03710 [Candidatus Kariarchaeaceae archaeon]|jgi:hypothetical protein
MTLIERHPGFLKRIKTDWSNIAKSDIEVENIKGVVYGYADELSILRLAVKYKDFSNVRHGYSVNMKTWYLSWELTS